MAAMLIARCRQAIVEPEAWPSLLDDDELKAAYAVYRQDEYAFGAGASVLGYGIGFQKKVELTVNKSTSLPTWLRQTTRALTLFKQRIVRQLPPNVRNIAIPLGKFDKGAKPFTVSSLQLLATYIGGILSYSAYQNKKVADAYHDEMIRRGIPAS